MILILYSFEPEKTQRLHTLSEVKTVVEVYNELRDFENRTPDGPWSKALSPAPSNEDLHSQHAAATIAADVYDAATAVHNELLAAAVPSSISIDESDVGYGEKDSHTDFVPSPEPLTSKHTTVAPEGSLKAGADGVVDIEESTNGIKKTATMTVAGGGGGGGYGVGHHRRGEGGRLDPSQQLKYWN